MRKNNGPVGPKIIGHLPNSTNQLLITDVLFKPKNPKDYKDREVNEDEQVPINIDQQNLPPTLPKVLIQKKDFVNDKTDGKKTGNSRAKNAMDYQAAKQRAEKRERLERQLSENTVRMNLIKKKKTINCKII